MRFLKHLLFLLLVNSQTNGLFAQFYVTGEPPASLHWERIQTTSFNIIFPSEMYEQANRFANKLEYYKEKTVDLSLNSRRKLPVIMQGMSVVSNGYVASTPDRMEIVPLPPQDSYAQDWLSQLAVHEFRHVAQINNLKKGFTRGLSFVTGQIAIGLSSAMVPAWLYEGDAVLQETRLSTTGRGRSSAFEMPLRTLLLTNPDTYSYEKSVFGSFKDFVPDHYQYGYQITGYAQARYGSSIWGKAIDYTGKNMFLVVPLVFYLEKNYGINRSKLYRQTIDSIRYFYNKKKESLTYTEYSILSKNKGNSYTNDILPQFTDSDHIIFLRTSIDHTDRLVMLDGEGYERLLKNTGITQGIGLSASAHYLVWDEIVRDIRWAKRSYSEIRLMNVETGKVRPLTRKTRYFSPDVSRDENTIVVVEADMWGQNSLVILDAATGKALRHIPSTGNAELQTPRWNGRNRIIAVTVSDEGKTISEADLETGRWDTVLANTFYNVAEPVGFKDYVIFRSNYTGIENLFAIGRNTSVIYQITSSKYGAFHPEVSPDSSRLVYSEYTEKGFDLAEMQIDTFSWQVVHTGKGPSGSWFSESAGIGDDPGNDDVSLIEGNEKDSGQEEVSQSGTYQYEARPYYKSLHVFRFHSWLPFYTNLPDVSTLDDIQVYPGFMLFSQNNLETVISTIGYAFSNGSHIMKPSIRWSGWYPVFEISGQLGYDNANGLLGSNSSDYASNISSNNRFELKAYIPMVFTRDSWIKSIQPLMALQHEDGDFGAGDDLFKGLDYLHAKLYLAAYKRLSKRDIYPRIGTELNLSAIYTPFNKTQLGNLYFLSANLYLPGIGAHHHIFIRAGWQQQDTKKYYLPVNQIKFPRGYSSQVSGTYSSIAVNYTFPVFYPDLSLPPVLYIKRLRANLFFDYGYGKDIQDRTSEEVELYTGESCSFGTELMADFHALHFIFPLSAGIRMGYLTPKDAVFASFLFHINTEL